MKIMQKKIYLILLGLIAFLAGSGDCLDRKKDCHCKIKVEGRVVGGKRAKADSFPWIGSISDDGYGKNIKRDYVLDKYKYQRGHLCGAILLNERWALTAAHCVTPTTAKYAVGFGSNDLVKVFDAGRIHIKKIVLFPFYEHDAELSDDIALLELEEPVHFNHTIQPACLSTNYVSKTKNKLVAAGFGFTKAEKLNVIQNRFVTKPNLSRYLKELTLKDVSPNSEICQIDPKKMCANSVRRGDSLCGGDSGGPIHHLEKGRAYVVGVSSSSNGYAHLKRNHRVVNFCDGKDVFQRIAPYLEFIGRYVGDYCRDIDFSA